MRTIAGESEKPAPPGKLRFPYRKSVPKSCREVLVWVGVILLVTLPLQATSAVTDVTIADVTPRAFSVVWWSDVPVTTASIQVYADAEGTVDLTSNMSMTLRSAAVPGAHSRGIVKVDVVSNAANRTLFVRTVTNNQTQPPAPPYIQVNLAATVSKANALSEPIINDLVRYQSYGVDGRSALPGSLVLVSAPQIGPYPLSAFVGENGLSTRDVVVDLNNLFDTAGTSAEALPGRALAFREMRGIECPGPANQSLTRFGRVPPHVEVPRISNVEDPTSCFTRQDTNCDDIVNVLDVQFLLNSFLAVSAQCAFNPQLDVVTDNVVNVLDLQDVFNRFGDVSP